MKINKTSWHYRLYSWTYSIWDTEWCKPATTNLCQYVQRLFWMPIVSVLLWGVMGTFFVCVLIPFMLLIGQRPTSWKKNTKIDLFVPYQGLRVSKKVELLPWHIIVPSAVIVLEYMWFHHANWKYPVLIQGCILAVLGIIVGIFLCTQSETYWIVSAWYGAKRQKVCPLVEFTDGPTNLE
jgi:hypothetical protein